MAPLLRSAPKSQPPTSKESHYLLVIAQLLTGYQTDLPKLAAMVNTATGGKMTEDTRSPWLIAAIAISEELKNQPPEVKAEIRRLSKKTYPETWKAIREKEQELGDGQK